MRALLLLLVLLPIVLMRLLGAGQGRRGRGQLLEQVPQQQVRRSENGPGLRSQSRLGQYELRTVQ